MPRLTMTAGVKSFPVVPEAPLALLSYCASSIAMTIMNKYVLSGHKFHMNFLLLTIQVPPLIPAKSSSSSPSQSPSQQFPCSSWSFAKGSDSSLTDLLTKRTRSPVQPAHQPKSLIIFPIFHRVPRLAPSRCHDIH